MNERRRQMMHFLEDFRAEFGRYPVVSEIAGSLTLNKKTVIDNLNMLQHLGYLTLVRDGFGYSIVEIVRMPGSVSA